jgi:tetratricopeptide (TPR) repeat protein
MRKFKRYNLHSEAATIYQEVRQELQALRWDCSTPLDTVLGLAFFLLEQGRNLEADTLLDAKIPKLIGESHIVLICCSMGANPDNKLIVELANAKMDGLGTGWEAILAIDRLGRHRAGDGDVQSGIIFAKKAYQLSQRRAGLHDPRTLRCLQGMVNAHLAEADMNAVARLFSEIGSLSPPQMRELTPEHPCSKMNYAIMMQQFGLPQLATTIVEELVSWLREQQVLGCRARDVEYRNTVAINIGGFLTKQGRLQEAEAFLKRVLAEPEGLSLAQISAAKTNLAGCLRRQLRTNEADALYQEIDADASDPVRSGGHEKGIFRIG